MDQPENPHDQSGRRDESDEQNDGSSDREVQPGNDAAQPDEQTERPDTASELRNKSAGWLLIAEHCSPDHQETVARPLEDLGGDASHIRDLFERVRQQALLMHHLHSAQAHAYTAMIEAGGPDDHEAMRAYDEATQFHIAVLGVNDTGEEPS